jgi:hypothetical protein
MMSDISNARRELLARILDGEGKAPSSQRRAAFDNSSTSMTEPLRLLVEKVASGAHAVTDADVARAVATGLSEDEVFELVVCAAVGEAERQYGAARAALEAALGGG